MHNFAKEQQWHLECDPKVTPLLLQAKEVGLDDLQGHLQIYHSVPLQFCVLGLLKNRLLKSSSGANFKSIKLVGNFLGKK